MDFILLVWFIFSNLGTQIAATDVFLKHYPNEISIILCRLELFASRSEDKELVFSDFPGIRTNFLDLFLLLFSEC